MEKILKYYMFDWDDNILHMPTPIHMCYNGEKQDILPGLFAKVRTDPNWVLCDDAFVEFSDTGDRKNIAFIEDIKKSLDGSLFGPCWDSFINAIVEGEIICIITARGHEPDTLRNGVKYVIENYLTKKQKKRMKYNIMYLLGLFKTDKCSPSELIDKYLEYCMFMGVNSETFNIRFNYVPEKGQPEIAKEMIANYFIEIINEQNKKLNYKFTIGMSDDDAGNIKQIKKFFTQSHYSNIVSLYVYDTSNPKQIIKTEIKKGN